MKKPKIIGFDFDGTTGDTAIPTYRALCGIFSDFHIAPPSFGDYSTNFGIEGAENFYRKRGISLSYQRLYDLYVEHLMRVHSSKPAEFFPDVLPGFAEIGGRNIMVGIVSAQVDVFVRACLQDLSCDEIERIKFISTGVRHKPTILTELMNTHEVDADSCWYVGDIPRDMSDAKEAGCVAVGFTRGNSTENSLRDAGADFCVKDMSGLLEILRPLEVEQVFA